MRPTVPTAAPTRRNLLLGGLGLGVLAMTGCSVAATPSATTTPHRTRPGDLPPDVAAAVRVGSAILGAERLIGQVVSTYPALGRRLAGLVAMHEVHLATLRTAVPGYVNPVTVDPTPASAKTQAAALRLVLTTERTLHDELITTAVAAESGRYARLFGSMSAAISQRLAAIPA